VVDAEVLIAVGVLNFVDDYLSILHVGGYLALSLILLKRHQARVRDHYSFNEKVSLAWLRRLLGSVLALYLFWFALEALPHSGEFYSQMDSILGLAMVALIYVMGYLGLKQPAIFSPKPASPALAEPTTNELPEPQAEADEPSATVQTQKPEQSAKYKKSSLPEDAAQQLAQELKLAMEKEQLYLNPLLSLPELAKHFGISTNYLSQVINEQLGLNFFDFVNRYRVEAAGELLRSTQKTVTDIAMAVGFNSKSVFYTAFRKHQGQTPGEYRKSA
jgi:AraC-like DNA-binding protein